MNIKHYLRYVFKQKKFSQVLQTVFCVLLQAGVNVLEYSAILFLGLGVDLIFTQLDAGIWNICLFIFFVILSCLCSVFVSCFRPYIQNSISQQLRFDLFGSIQRRPYLFDQQKHGEWYELTVNQINEFSFDAWQIILKTIEVMISVITILIILVNMNVSIALSLSAVSALIVIAVMRIMKIALKTHEMRQQADRNYTSILSENIDHIKTIKSNQYYKGRWKKDTDAANIKFKADCNHLRSVLICMTSEKAAEIICYIVVFCISIFQLMEGNATYGSLIIALSYSASLLLQLSQINYIYDMWQSNKSIYQALVDSGMNAGKWHDQENGMRNSIEKESISTIQIEQYHFSYQNTEVLTDITLYAEKGDVILIQGASGNGKTTLLKSILGLLDAPPALKKDRNNSTMGLLELRTYMAYLSQQPFVFHDTIRNNLRICLPRESDEKLNEILQAVGLESLGLEKNVGETGSLLSGGEKQRLAFARIYTMEKGIYLLDEPLAHLDEQSQKKILRLISKLKDSIVIIVSHQPISSELHYKKIYFERGKIT